MATIDSFGVDCSYIGYKKDGGDTCVNLLFFRARRMQPRASPEHLGFTSAAETTPAAVGRDKERCARNPWS